MLESIMVMGPRFAALLPLVVHRLARPSSQFSINVLVPSLFNNIRRRRYCLLFYNGFHLAHSPGGELVQSYTRRADY
jgi:hypothetical protein